MPFPFALPRVTRGFVEMSPGARAIGTQAAEAIASALSSVLGARVRLEGTAVPGPPRRAAGMAVVEIALQGVSGAGALEVDAAFLARVLDRLSAAASCAPAALAATDLERSFLALLALVAIDAASSPAVDALVPRVLLEGSPYGAEPTAPLPTDDLIVALDLGVGDDRGRGQLRLPTAAVRALAPGVAPSTACTDLAIDASWRRGTVTLAPDELAAIGCGDVLLLDERGELVELVLPGGLAIVGRAEHDVLHVEEIRMTEPQAAYPITLTVEVARVTVTLGELARLEPGSALSLGARKDGAVVLRAGERAVARGQLVDVEGALGVRIAQLGASP